MFQASRVTLRHSQNEKPIVERGPLASPKPPRNTFQMLSVPGINRPRKGTFLCTNRGRRDAIGGIAGRECLRALGCWKGWEGGCRWSWAEEATWIANGPPPIQVYLYLSSFDFRAAQAGHTSQQGLFQETATRAGPPTRAGCLVALVILLTSGSEF